MKTFKVTVYNKENDDFYDPYYLRVNKKRYAERIAILCVADCFNLKTSSLRAESSVDKAETKDRRHLDPNKFITKIAVLTEVEADKNAKQEEEKENVKDSTLPH